MVTKIRKEEIQNDLVDLLYEYVGVCDFYIVDRENAFKQVDRVARLFGFVEHHGRKMNTRITQP